jgi:DNA invertase Pin-like site-specific DNA recombinase
MEEEKQTRKRIYCAAYCRKSIEERADEAFGSIENQHEAILSFIASHKHEGWMPLTERYDDNGFTGSNTNRPSLQRLLNDIKEGRVNMVIVYKLDRLSRSLVDFVQLLKFFDEHGVAFASVTQPIDTSTSTGKLMLHILSSFAEFERELISERTRDKMCAARKRGKWTGGIAPLGYRVDKENKKLIIDPEGAKVVKEIFDLYLKGNSTLKIVQIFNEKGYKTNELACKNGKTLGGVKYSVAKIQWMLRHAIYAGKARYNGQIYDGEHEAIIDEETFKRTQALLDQNHRERKVTKNTDCTGLLSHILHCKVCGTFMVHTYTIKNETHKYRYYTCTNAQKFGHSSCPTRSVNSKAIEDAVIESLRKIFTDNHKKGEHQYKQEIDALLSPVWDTLYPQEKRRILKILLKEVDYTASNKKLGITLADNNLRLEFEVDLKQVRPLNKWHKEEEIEKEPKLRRNLILAYHLKNLFAEKKASAAQAAQWLNMHEERIHQLLNLLLLSPKIQEDIVCSDNQKISSIPEYKLRPIINEADWQNQGQMWQELFKDTTPNPS